MNTKAKLKKLKADAHKARDFLGAAWDNYTAAEKVYGDARAAAKIDYIAAGKALRDANEDLKDAGQVINQTREIK